MLRICRQLSIHWRELSNHIGPFSLCRSDRQGNTPRWIDDRKPCPNLSGDIVMFTKSAVAAAAVALAVANIASAQSFNNLSQQAIDFQRNCEAGCPAAGLPTKLR